MVQVLLLGHPRRLIRDTAFYPPLMRRVGPTGRLKPQALGNLAAAQLGLAIQAGEHSPVDDARATLYLYHRHRKVSACKDLCLMLYVQKCVRVVKEDAWLLQAMNASA